MAATSPRRHWTARLALGLLIVLFFVPVVHFALTLPELGTSRVLVDFDAFYIVGQLVAEGRAAHAHDVAIMAEIQRSVLGHEGFMPWTYPPQFDLIAGLLAQVPRGLSYGLFTGLTLGLWLLLMARLAGQALVPVLGALAPPILVGAAIGQNAFLTGALMAGFVLLTLKGRDSAGWMLGLLVIKPHLGVGLGLHALAAGRWRVIGYALTVAALSSLLATLAFGPGIWGAFREGLETAGRALATGFYPLYRMTSVYALLHTLGAPSALAFWAQLAVALAACALVVLAVRRGMAARRSLALACFASVLVSPYLYDYDLTMVGVGLALVAGDVLERTGLIERLLLLAVSWMAGGWGMVHAVLVAGLDWEDRAALTREMLAYGAFAYLLLLAMLARILMRPARVAA